MKHLTQTNPVSSQPPARKDSAFTLIELLVVVSIIAVLAALIIPALQRAQAKAMGMKCISIGKAIASSVRAYSSSWDGWTNPDPEYFVKEFGYKLNLEEGYAGEAAGTWATDTASNSYQHAQSASDFVCPVDEGPKTTKHAVRSSYAVTSAFAGQNVMNMTTEANRTLVVKELGERRHVTEGERLERTFVYADLSATLGYTGDALPGARVRIWHANTTSYFTTVESALPDPEFETEYTADWSYNTSPFYGSLNGLLGTDTDNDWYPIPRSSTSNYRRRWPYKVTARWDGILRIPREGIWEIKVHGNDKGMYFGISSNGHDKVMDAEDETAWTTAVRNNWWITNTWDATNTITVQLDPKLWYAIKLYTWGNDYPTGAHYVSVRLQDGDGGYDPDYNGAGGMALPANWVNMLP